MLLQSAITNLHLIADGVADDAETLTNADLDDPFPKDGQEEICELFRDFVRVHQSLLNTIIGKNSIISGSPFTDPVTAVLRLIETGVDDFAFALIDLVPSCADEAKSDKKDLDKTFEDVFDSL